MTVKRKKDPSENRAALSSAAGPALSGPRPLYQQVKNYIESRIGSGEWQPNTRVPSEQELVDILGVSRMTANRAMRELTAEGSLVRVQGVGTFVAEPKSQSAFLEIRSIDSEIKERGGLHSSDILLLQEETSSAELAQAMGLETGARVFHSILIHRENGLPIQYADRYINPVVAPDFLDQDFSRMTPSSYLSRVAPATEVEHMVEAVMPDARLRSLLEIGPEEACLVLHRSTWVHNAVATRNRFVCPGSRYRIGGRFKLSGLGAQIFA